jgi:hypothetical protein
VHQHNLRQLSRCAQTTLSLPRAEDYVQYLKYSPQVTVHAATNQPASQPAGQPPLSKPQEFPSHLPVHRIIPIRSKKSIVRSTYGADVPCKSSRAVFCLSRSIVGTCGYSFPFRLPAMLRKQTANVASHDHNGMEPLVGYVSWFRLSGSALSWLCRCGPPTVAVDTVSL